MNESPINSLQSTFRSLDREETGVIKKDALRQAIIYTGDNYDKKIINEEIDKCPQEITVERFIQIFELAEVERNQRM